MDPLTSFTDKLKRSRFLRLMLVCLLASLLFIPIAAISGLVSERVAKRDEAETDVAGKWGGPQAVAGPALIVPYVRRSMVKQKDGSQEEVIHTFRARLLPEDVTFACNAESEIRHRGLYEIPLFKARTKVSGSFKKPDASQFGVDAADVHWDRAKLVVELSEPRALREQVTLRWNGLDVSFEPGAGDQGGTLYGIHAPVSFTGDSAKFSFQLAHAGSKELRFAPVARSTTASVRANWPHPSFQGEWLPNKSDISARGFLASWSVPHLGRNYPQLSHDESGPLPPLMGKLFGVDLIAPVDTYKMCDRSVKYAGLVLMLTFVLVWVLEVLGDFRLHSIPYLLTGAGICVFFLLQLSLAEHLGFLKAHLIASVMIVLLVTGYSLFTLGNRGRALSVGGVLSFLYAYLFVMFQLETYALLIGSLAVFGALGAVMYLTRRVSW